MEKKKSLEEMPMEEFAKTRNSKVKPGKIRSIRIEVVDNGYVAEVDRQRGGKMEAAVWQPERKVFQDLDGAFGFLRKELGP